jgi:hypothetical protein
LADAKTKEEKERIEKELEEAKGKVKLLREADGREVDKNQ